MKNETVQCKTSQLWACHILYIIVIWRYPILEGDIYVSALTGSSENAATQVYIQTQLKPPIATQHSNQHQYPISIYVKCDTKYKAGVYNNQLFVICRLRIRLIWLVMNRKVTSSPAKSEPGKSNSLLRVALTRSATTRRKGGVSGKRLDLRDSLH